MNQKENDIKKITEKINKTRTNKFKRNVEQEKLLKIINKNLLPVENELTKQFNFPSLPVIFIVGVPRSGTTLISQLIADHGDFSYISNFLAKFWETPYLGSIIERATEIRNNRVSYDSNYGNTFHLSEPHEFTYFWEKWFDKGQEIQFLKPKILNKINKKKLKSEVAAIEDGCASGPVIFKNPYWTNLQINFLKEVFPNHIFLNVKRNPFFVCQSIVNARKKVRGSKDKWWSLKPKEYFDFKDLSWEKQVVRQVYYTKKHIEKSLSTLNDERILNINYEDLCANPSYYLELIIKKTNQFGARIDNKVSQLDLDFNSRNEKKLSDDEYKILLNEYNKFFNSEKEGLNE